MFRNLCSAILLSAIAGLGAWSAHSQSPIASPPKPATLDERFTNEVKPFLDRYCISCHGANKPKADLNLAHDKTVEAIARNEKQWELVLERLHAGDMPPEDAKMKPNPEERAAVVAWLNEVRAREADRNAGDPGIVLARRFSNAEYDNTIRDLTGIDIRPTASSRSIRPIKPGSTTRANRSRCRRPFSRSISPRLATWPITSSSSPTASSSRRIRL